MRSRRSTLPMRENDEALCGRPKSKQLLGVLTVLMCRPGPDLRHLNSASIRTLRRIDVRSKTRTTRTDSSAQSQPTLKLPFSLEGAPQDV